MFLLVESFRTSAKLNKGPSLNFASSINLPLVLISSSSINLPLFLLKTSEKRFNLLKLA